MSAIFPYDASSAAGRWRRRLAPLGVPTLIAADDPALLEKACAAYADWNAGMPTDAAAIEIEVRLAEDAIDGTGESIHVEGSRLRLASPGIEAEADARTGRGRCAVSAASLGREAGSIARAIDTILLFLLARMGRPPLHAAGILLGDMALLLAGRSGAGKSTLALAAAAQGMPVLSDDTIHVQLEPRLRVWGLSRPVHVFPAEAPNGDHPIRLQAGKSKAAVALPEAVTARRADRAILIVLDRGERLALDPISVDTALAVLMQLDSGFDLLRAQSAAAVAALAAAGTWRLTLTADPAAAIALLKQRFG